MLEKTERRIDFISTISISSFQGPFLPSLIPLVDVYCKRWKCNKYATDGCLKAHVLCELMLMLLK
jgi:hypothetical protein